VDKTKTYIETQHLGGIINSVVAGLRADAENAGATLNIDFKSVYEDQFPLVYMQSVFHNLLTNAIKFRDAKRPLVISFEGKKLGDNTFRFTITDNGLGFDAERVKGKLFGIFKRFHAQIEGTGIGLHITKSIVDAYGGNITVNSKPGDGATFVITLKNPILV
jgi:signal transduction histidine kinase